jgi:hypothetical protein
MLSFSIGAMRHASGIYSASLSALIKLSSIRERNGPLIYFDQLSGPELYNHFCG